MSFGAFCGGLPDPCFLVLTVVLQEHVSLVFLDIGNIHVVRSSMTALVRACSEENEDDMFAGIGNSQWMSHLSSILKGGVAIAQALQ